MYIINNTGKIFHCDWLCTDDLIATSKRKDNG